MKTATKPPRLNVFFILYFFADCSCLVMKGTAKLSTHMSLEILSL